MVLPPLLYAVLQTIRVEERKIMQNTKQGLSVEIPSKFSEYEKCGTETQFVINFVPAHEETKIRDIFTVVCF